MRSPGLGHIVGELLSTSDVHLFMPGAMCDASVVNITEASQSADRDMYAVSTDLSRRIHVQGFMRSASRLTAFMTSMFGRITMREQY